MKKYQTTLICKKRVAKDIIELALARPKGFDFRAGQYIQLGVPHLLHSDAAGRSRVMSIASSPHNQNEMFIAFRDTGSGYKHTLKQLHVGAPLVIEGPYGFFTLADEPTYPLVFIAGGIGITPYLSMLQYAVAVKMRVPITLLYASSSDENTAYLKELHELVQRSPAIKVKHKFGKIDEQFVMENVSTPKDCIWYVSGPPVMIASVRNLLFQGGIDDSKICFEEFTGY